MFNNVKNVEGKYWDFCPQNYSALEGRPVSIALSILNIKHGLHVCWPGGAPVLLLPLRGPHHHLLRPLQHAQVLRAPGEFLLELLTT